MCVAIVVLNGDIDKEQKELEKKQEEEKEKQWQIKKQEMIKNHYIIPLEEPVEVARKLRKKKNKGLFPDVNSEKAKRMKKRIEKEEEEIRKKGVYYIKGKYKMYKTGLNICR